MYPGILDCGISVGRGFRGVNSVDPLRFSPSEDHPIESVDGPLGVCALS